jgi:hypothetical protein
VRGIDVTSRIRYYISLFLPIISYDTARLSRRAYCNAEFAHFLLK